MNYDFKKFDCDYLESSYNVMSNDEKIGCVGKVVIYDDFIQPEDLYETHRPLFYDSEDRRHYRWGYRMTIKLIDEKDFLKK